MNAPPVIGFVITANENLKRANTLARRKGCHLITTQCGLEDALMPARKMVEKDGVEVFLSRRGTAYMLRQHMEVPVISLPDSTVSLVRAVKKARSMGTKIAITLFQLNSAPISFCEELLGVHLETIIYAGKESLDSGVRAAKDNGADVIIGGGMTQLAAEKYGIPCIELHANDEITEGIFENLINVVHTRRQTIEKNARYLAIFNGVSDGIVAVDAVGCISELNDRAHALLNLESSNVVGRKIQDIFPQIDIAHTFRAGKKIASTVISHQDKLLLVNGLPIRESSGGNSLMGAVYTMQPAEQVFQAEERVRESYKKGLSARYRLENFWHKDPDMVDMLKRIRLYAATRSTVLLTGETGTGKEILAQGIHNASPRHTRPFVSINCSAMPEQLLESELFGYTEGAFTGSRRGGKIGMFELAQGGTIFLDEIGTIPFAFQTRLLRVLQEKEIMRIGSNVVTPVDVRIIAASNRNLGDEVRAGRLREDLYFRLNVLSVKIPPLRKRRGDIALIFKNLLREAALRNRLPEFSVPNACTERLCRFSWPGNVRQLQSFVEHLVVLSPHGFDQQVFFHLVNELEQYSAKMAIADGELVTNAFSTGETQPETAKSPVTPDQIRAALAYSGNAKGVAARQLGISRSTLWRMLKRWDIAAS